ncbi:phosphotransferase [Acidipropionibacterium jensenii]|uniref:phosphotransferase n=1 Tax=Acidipropionibacterium jensenii TaxID=1749 RepID=UPI00214C333F|nr:phosphotransferase [Acidipropionibacterium jensenii]
MSGEPLGGYQGAPRRLGGTVHRGPIPDFSVLVLKELRRRGWRKAPVVIASNADSCVLSYIDGMAATTRMLRNEAVQLECLTEVTRIVREFHDLLAGADLAGDREVVCHNDLQPPNTIYRRISGRLLPVALIDWDQAAPGDRLDDLAQLCWRFTGLGRSASCETVRERIAVILRTYGWRAGTKPVTKAMLRCQQKARDQIQVGAGDGDDMFQRLRDAGALESIQRDRDWTKAYLVD